MNKTTEALKLAKESLESLPEMCGVEEALAAIREALAEPVKQEPVAFVSDVHLSRYTIEWNGQPLPEGTELYSEPVQSVDEYHIELMAEEAECVKLSLDKAGVPNSDENGERFSLWGRVCRYAEPLNAKAIRADLMKQVMDTCEAEYKLYDEMIEQDDAGHEESCALIHLMRKLEKLK